MLETSFGMYNKNEVLRRAILARCCKRVYVLLVPGRYMTIQRFILETIKYDTNLRLNYTYRFLN